MEGNQEGEPCRGMGRHGQRGGRRGQGRLVLTGFDHCEITCMPHSIHMAACPARPLLRAPCPTRAAQRSRQSPKPRQTGLATCATSRKEAGGATLQQTAGAAGAASPARGASRQSDAFDERCKQLEAFYKEHGHTRVPVQEPSGWCSSRVKQTCHAARSVAQGARAESPTSLLLPPVQAWASGWRGSGTPGRPAACPRRGGSGWRRWASAPTLLSSPGTRTSSSWPPTIRSTATAACRRRQ